MEGPDEMTSSIAAWNELRNDSPACLLSRFHDLIVVITAGVVVVVVVVVLLLLKRDERR